MAEKISHWYSYIVSRDMQLNVTDNYAISNLRNTKLQSTFI